MYGAGLRVMECLRLRVKDIDDNYRQITVHDGKGSKDRRTLLQHPEGKSVNLRSSFSDADKES